MRVSGITVIVNAKGKIVTDRQGIAEVMASFYESLYRGKVQDKTINTTQRVEEFTLLELKTALKKTKKGKAKDCKRIVAEIPIKAPPRIGIKLKLIINSFICTYSLLDND